MKNVIIVSTLYNIPGINQMVKFYANEISKKEDVKVSVVIPKDDESLLDFNDNITVKTIQWVYKEKGISIFYRIRDFVNTIKSLNGDVVHFFNEGFYSINILKKLKKEPLVKICTIHDVEHHTESKSLIEKFFIKLSNRKYLDKYLDKHHVHGIKDKDLLVKSVSKEVYVASIIPPISKSVMEGVLVSEELSKISPDKTKILFFGRIHPYKGLDEFIKVYNKCEDVQLIIAGKGEFEEKVDDNVVLINRFIKNEEIRSIFEKSDVVVLPYVNATHSGVVFLAALFRKPVLISKVGSLEQYVDEGSNGYFFEDIYNVDSSVEDIKKILKCDLEALGNNNYNKLIRDIDESIRVHFKNYERK